jgi:hypothetical protein
MNNELFNLMVQAILNKYNIRLALSMTLFSPKQEVITILSLKFGVDKLIISLIIAFLL